MSASLAVYTVVMGDGYSLPKTVPQPRVDYICFTNIPDLVPNGWSLKVVPPLLPADLVRSSREQKIRPHRWLRGYSRSLYIDASVQLIEKPLLLWDHLIKDELNVLGLMHHSYRDNILDEFEAVLKAGFDDKGVLAKQIEAYKKYFPKTLNDKPNWGGLLARRHNEPACIEAMEIWFANVMRYSRRDQLSLPVAMSVLSEDRYRVVSGDIHGAEFHIWPRNGNQRPKRYFDELHPGTPGKEEIVKLTETTQTSSTNKTEEKDVSRQQTVGHNLTGASTAETVPADNKNVEFGYDDAVEMFFARDLYSGEKVYVSDRKRLELYVKGPQHRQNWLLSDYGIPNDLVGTRDLVVDVGANSGELGIWVQSVGGRYVGIEPDPKAFRALQKNVSSPFLYQIALSDGNGGAEFYLNTKEADSSLFRPDVVQGKISVEVKTLDTVLSALGIPGTIRLLKIEAEGMEPEVIAGAALSLQRVEYIAVDAGPERGGENTVPGVLNALSPLGFEIVSCYLRRGTFLLKNTRLEYRENGTLNDSFRPHAQRIYNYFKAIRVFGK